MMYRHQPLIACSKEAGYAFFKKWFTVGRDTGGGLRRGKRTRANEQLERKFYPNATNSLRRLR
jgi:hypothetical protein